MYWLLLLAHAIELCKDTPLNFLVSRKKGTIILRRYLGTL